MSAERTHKFVLEELNELFYVLMNPKMFCCCKEKWNYCCSSLNKYRNIIKKTNKNKNKFTCKEKTKRFLFFLYD